MKNGGADIHVLRRDKPGFVVEHMRRYFDHAVTRERAPDAYAAVALWFDPSTPGRPRYQATYCTVHDAIPAPLLVRMAGAYLIAEHAVHTAEDRTLGTLGYEPNDWTPDDAA